MPRDLKMEAQVLQTMEQVRDSGVRWVHLGWIEKRLVAPNLLLSFEQERRICKAIKKACGALLHAGLLADGPYQGTFIRLTPLEVLARQVEKTSRPPTS